MNLKEHTINLNEIGYILSAKEDKLFPYVTQMSDESDWDKMGNEIGEIKKRFKFM